MLKEFLQNCIFVLLFYYMKPAYLIFGTLRKLLKEIFPFVFDKNLIVQQNEIMKENKNLEVRILIKRYPSVSIEGD